MALVLTGSLVIDCNNLSCLTFTDTTGAYSVSNTGGYGSPNPAISDIVKINFTVTDGDANAYLYEDVPYTPNAAGTQSICLEAANFLDGSTPLELTAGASYTLTYSVEFNSTGTVSASVTQAAGVSQPQISRITVSGPITGGTVITVTLNGEAVNYTVTTGQTNNQIVTGIVNAIIAYSAANPSSDWANEVSISSGGGNIDVQWNSNNVSFTLTATKLLSYSIERNFVFPCCGEAINSNLTTNFSIQQNIGCAAIVFTDTTGSYNVSTNPGGYGTPNPAYADITNTLITFELSNGDTVEYTAFVPTAMNQSITLQAADLGYSAGIPDQIMTVTYSVYVEGDCRVGYKSTQVLLYCQTETCINNQIQSVLQGDCTCNDENCKNTDRVFDMLMMLDVLKIAATKNMSCIDGKIEALYQKCNGGGCSSC